MSDKREQIQNERIALLERQLFELTKAIEQVGRADLPLRRVFEAYTEGMLPYYRQMAERLEDQRDE